MISLVFFLSSVFLFFITSEAHAWPPQVFDSYCKNGVIADCSKPGTHKATVTDPLNQFLTVCGSGSQVLYCTQSPVGGDPFEICCKDTGIPSCAKAANDPSASCKDACAAGEEEVTASNNCDVTGHPKCCKPKTDAAQQQAQSQTGSGAACELGPNKAKGSCISASDNYDQKRCKNLRTDNPVLDGGFAEFTCPDGISKCCIQDPTWAPNKPAAATASAVKAPAPTSYALSNPLGTTSIPVVIGRIIKMFLGIVGALALLVFVYGGVAWMTARGDAGQVKHAQQAIQGAVLGLIIISGSYLFADSFIKALTEMQITTTTGAGGGASATESTQATTEQTTLEQQQAAAAAAAKAKAGGGGAVCIGDQTSAKACQADCKQFCLNQAIQANVGSADHPCTNLGQNGCPTDQVCCSWKK